MPNTTAPQKQSREPEAGAGFRYGAGASPPTPRAFVAGLDAAVGCGHIQIADVTPHLRQDCRQTCIGMAPTFFPRMRP